MAVKIKFKKLLNNAHIPMIGTKNSAGYDLFACIDNDIVVYTNGIVLVSTGISIELPEGYFGIICSRSGLASKHGIHVLNSPGIIDSDYRGEIKCILHNCSDNTFIIQTNTRIAQLLILKHETVQWMESEDLSSTSRGINGFGSTGL